MLRDGSSDAGCAVQRGLPLRDDGIWLWRPANRGRAGPPAHVDDNPRSLPKVLPQHHRCAHRALPVAHRIRKRRRAGVGPCGSVGSRCMGEQKSAKRLMRAELAATSFAPADGLFSYDLRAHCQVTARALHAINLVRALGCESWKRSLRRSSATCFHLLTLEQLPNPSAQRRTTWLLQPDDLRRGSRARCEEGPSFPG
jgi:hypothetical protein